MLATYNTLDTVVSVSLFMSEEWWVGTKERAGSRKVGPQEPGERERGSTPALRHFWRRAKRAEGGPFGSNASRFSPGGYACRLTDPDGGITSQPWRAPILSP